MTDEIAPPTTDDFLVASRVELMGDGRYRAEVPDGWQQGRGAFGGLVLGTLARAMLHAEPEAERTLRALSGEIVGPVLPGAVDLTVNALRRGNAVSSWEARLSQNGEVLARASAVLGRARAADRDGTDAHAPAIAKPWREVDVIPVRPPLGPHFARMFEFRADAWPFQGGPRAEVEGWVRLAKPVPLGVPEVVALADAYWPALFAVETAPRPMATVSFTLELHADPATLDPAEPLRYRASAPATRQGYATEFRELWTARGELVALNQQVFVVIK